jgi:hypothetical protein
MQDQSAQEKLAALSICDQAFAQLATLPKEQQNKILDAALIAVYDSLSPSDKGIMLRHLRSHVERVLQAGQGVQR